MDRRAFLHCCGGASTAVLAGCLEADGEPRSDDDGPDGSGVELGAYEPVARWAVPPHFDQPTDGLYRVGSFSPPDILAFDDELSAELGTHLKLDVPYYVNELEIDLASFDLGVNVLAATDDEESCYQVLVGDFDEDALRDRLADAVDGSPERYRGYDVYPEIVRDVLAEDYRTTKSFGVAEGTLVQAGDVYELDIDGTAADVERLLDVGIGDDESFVDQHDGARTLAAELDPAAESRFHPSDPDVETDAERGQFSGAVVGGRYTELDGSTVRHHRVEVFEGADVVPESALEEYSEGLVDRELVQSADFDVDGRVATVTTTMPPEGYLEL